MNDPIMMIQWLEQAVDLSARRASLLQSNVANADTPGYVPSDLKFDQYLESALVHGSGGAEPTAERILDVEPSLDGNRVDLDREIVALSENKVRSDLSLELISRRFSLSRYAIDEGGR